MSILNSSHLFSPAALQAQALKVYLKTKASEVKLSLLAHCSCSTKTKTKQNYDEEQRRVQKQS